MHKNLKQRLIKAQIFLWMRVAAGWQDCVERMGVPEKPKEEKVTV